MTNRRSEVKIECPKCNGTGKASTTKCKLCVGNGMGPFYHAVIRVQEAPSSRHNITNDLRDFAFWLGLDNLEELNGFCRINDKFKKEILKTKIQDFLSTELRGNRRLIYKTQEEKLGAIKQAYERVEDIRGKIDWKELHKDYVRHPVGLRSVKKAPYSHSDIKKLFDHSDPVRLQYKPIIALLASSGIRLGVIHEEELLKWRIIHTEKKDVPYLKFKALKPATEGFTQEQLDYVRRAIPKYQETFRIHAYSEEVDPKTGKEYEYITYCSPEAHDLIIEMRKQRERDGEVITEDSPVFRSEYNPNRTRWGWKCRGRIVSKEERERLRRSNLENPTPVAHHAIQSYIDCRRQRYLGYKVMHDVSPGKARKDGPQLIHGFRYFHETTMGIKGVDKHVMEWLQGRELKTLAELYDNWPPEEILREYWKAVPALTIDQRKYLELTIEEKDETIHKKDKEIAKLEDQDYLWHHKHKATEQRVDKIENMLEHMFTKFGIPLPDKPDTDKPQAAIDNGRLDRIEAMVSKLLPVDDQPKGLIEMVSSLELKDNKEKTDNEDTGEEG